MSTLGAVYGNATLERWRREDEQRRADARGDYGSNWRGTRAVIETPVAGVRETDRTALRTRASPFAAYMVQMHTRIHERFANGYIAGLPMLGPPRMSNAAENALADMMASQDTRVAPSATSASEQRERAASRSRGGNHDDPRIQHAMGLNDPTLHTVLELSINAEGAVHTLRIASSSGFLPFDVAAINALRGSAPFPPTPAILRSYDGMVYVRWHFRRWDNFCNGAEPIILRAPTPPPAVPITPVGELPQPETPSSPRSDGGVPPRDASPTPAVPAPPDSLGRPDRVAAFTAPR
jgi:TonB family protein